jgi:hypothetical protein
LPLQDLSNFKWHVLRVDPNGAYLKLWWPSRRPLRRNAPHPKMLSC